LLGEIVVADLEIAKARLDGEARLASSPLSFRIGESFVARRSTMLLRGVTPP